MQGGCDCGLLGRNGEFVASLGFGRQRVGGRVGSGECCDASPRQFHAALRFHEAEPWLFGEHIGGQRIVVSGHSGFVEVLHVVRMRLHPVHGALQRLNGVERLGPVPIDGERLQDERRLSRAAILKGGRPLMTGPGLLARDTAARIEGLRHAHRGAVPLLDGRYNEDRTESDVLEPAVARGLESSVDGGESRGVGLRHLGLSRDDLLLGYAQVPAMGDGGADDFAHGDDDRLRLLRPGGGGPGDEEGGRQAPKASRVLPSLRQAIHGVTPS